MGASGGAPSDWAQQIDAAEVLPSFASMDIREKKKKIAAEVGRIKLPACMLLLTTCFRRKCVSNRPTGRSLWDLLQQFLMDQG